MIIASATSAGAAVSSCSSNASSKSSFHTEPTRRFSASISRSPQALTTSAEGVAPTVGVWQHYTFDLDTLVGLGFNLASMKLVMVFPTWGTGDGAVVRLDNVMFNPPE